MNKFHQKFYQIITIWAALESFLGGIIHGLHLPISGIFVGSGSLVCIALIGWNFPHQYSIIKAGLIVGACKFIVSPQSPPTAYLALAFQVSLGQILFYDRKYFMIKSYWFAIIALLESAFQRLLVLMVFFGKNFIHSFDGWLMKSIGMSSETSIAMVLAIGYVAIHILIGILIGYWIADIPKIVESKRLDSFQLEDINLKETPIRTPLLNFFILILILSLLGLGLYLFNNMYLLWLVIRMAIVLSIWFLVIIPLFRWILEKWYTKSSDSFRQDVLLVIDALPSTLGVLKQIWGGTKGNPFLKRIRFFYVHLILYLSN